MGERVSINTDRYQLIQESGLRAPSMRLTYATPSFQNLVESCFGDILPRIKFTDSEVPYFENRDAEERETCILANKVQSIEEIPRYESIRLLEGWLRIQTLAHHPEISPAEASMMQTFMLPDPIRDIRQYRIYTDLQDDKRLHILWGFSTKTTPKSAILAEYAIATLLGVSTESLGELAEAECDPEVYQAWANCL